MVSSPVKAQCFRISKHYLKPTSDAGADAITDYVVSVMAFLGAWVSFSDILPAHMRTHDLKPLFDFVLEMQLVLTSHVGRCCLNQRVEELREDPGSSVWEEFDIWMEQLVSGTERAIGKVVQFACGLPVPGGLLFDQLAHAALLLGVRCENFDPDDRVTRHLNCFVHKITKLMYDEQCLGATANQPVSAKATQPLLEQ